MVRDTSREQIGSSRMRPVPVSGLHKPLNIQVHAKENEGNIINFGEKKV